jgi:hypothetical protein
MMTCWVLPTTIHKLLNIILESLRGAMHQKMIEISILVNFHVFPMFHNKIGQIIITKKTFDWMFKWHFKILTQNVFTCALFPYT